MKKRLLKWKYQKLTLLIGTFILAYLLFYGKNFPAFNNFIISTGYIGIFISGLLFSYGFTSAPAAALFLLLAKSTNFGI